MEQSNDNNVFSPDEIEVAKIMLELPRLILESEMHPERYVRWGGRRKRKTKTKRKRSNSLEQTFAVEEIKDYSLGNELPNKEIELKKQFLDQQKAKHLELNAKKQKLSQSLDKVEEEPGSEIFRGLCLGLQITESSQVNENNEDHHQHRFFSRQCKQPIIIDQMEIGENSVHPVRETIPCLPSDKGRSLRSDDNVVPNGIIDLNLPPVEEALEFNSNDVRNSNAAEARLKRMQICRSKKRNAASKVR